MKKPLPVGIQTFRDIIEGGFLYVDKTRWFYELVRYPKGVYFLARPRRFGKSLLISTLKEVFEGNRELFQGLWLYDSPYRWETYPIIRLDFSLCRVESAAELKVELANYIQEIARDYGITLQAGGYQKQLRDLIRQLATKNKVVILIDEYDKPIIDNIENVKKAQRIREVLKGFYAVIKGMDAYLRFVLLTGISKFSKVGVFSGLNNLEDVTMSPAFASALGITEEEIATDFNDYIVDFAQKEGVSSDALLKRMRQWYNGFCFAAGGQNVYNPFSLLLFFKQQRFANFWFETGTPTFLIQLIRKRAYDVKQIDTLAMSELSFSSYEIEDLKVVPLLFQTGYLTIKGYDPETRLYQLYYPNYEVEHAFLENLLNSFSHTENGLAEGYLWKLVWALQDAAFERFFEILDVFFAEIPYEIQIKKERYYQTIFYLIFKLIGLKVDVEVRTSRGRIDAVVELEEGVFIFEFKLDASEEEALKQIKASAYFERYRLKGKAIHLVGVRFDTEKRGIAGWQVERSGVEAVL